VEEQALNLKESFRVVLRYRRAVAICAAAGLVLGVVAAAVLPSYSTAKSVILLPPSPVNSSGTPTRNIQDDVALALSPLILTPAAKAAHIDLPIQTLQKRLTVSAVSGTDDVISIVAKGTSGAQAIVLANAVANQFLAYSASAASNLDVTTEQNLQVEVNELTSDISGLKTQVTNDTNVVRTTTDPQTHEAAQQALDSALSAENYESQNLQTLKTELGNIKQASGAQALDAEIIQKATAAQDPSKRTFLEFGGIGLVAGLLVGIVAAFVRGRKDRRLRRRDEIARAAGVAVLASVSASPKKTSEDLLGILEHFEPSVGDKAAMRRLMDELGVPRHAVHPPAGASQNGSSAPHQGVDLTAFVLAGDAKAITAAAELPAFAATLGMRVALVVGGDDPATRQLSVACAARDALDPGATRPNFLTYASSPGNPPEGVDFAVRIEVVNPVTVDVADWDSPKTTSDRISSTVLILSSGYATPEEVEVIAIAAEHHGQPLVGVVVADPEPSDRTAGQTKQRLVGMAGPRQISAFRSAHR
jgi:capsular polysaccharide biosynthesis protein